jgi:hypothetical protein
MFLIDEDTLRVKSRLCSVSTTLTDHGTWTRRSKQGFVKIWKNNRYMRIIGNKENQDHPV